ncbi:MAG TPA: hypothetical protein VF775_05100 [Geobacteraceae bacterium]
MKKLILIMMAALALSGCATLEKPGGVLYRSGQGKKLARVENLLKHGKTSAATKLLAEICTEPGVPGVTDEALIRLSLLKLAAGQQARRDLERLTKEYPTSSWAPLAANLIEHLDAADDAREQNRKLTKENKELHQSIEQLKSLELEMGKGGKR